MMRFWPISVPVIPGVVNGFFPFSGNREGGGGNKLQFRVLSGAAALAPAFLRGLSIISFKELIFDWGSKGEVPA